MTNATLRFNDKAAEQLLAVYVTPDMAEQRQQVIGLLQLKPGEKALDIGSGPGFLASAMADIVGSRGEVCGIDISPELLALAGDRYRHQTQLKFLHAEASSLPFADACFDVVTVTQVLEYLPDVRPALLEVHRVLRPGGQVLILDTDWDSIVWHAEDTARMKKILSAWDAHLADPYLPRTLGSSMRETGFQVGEQKVIPLFNPEFREESFSNRMIDLIGPFVTGRNGITAEEVMAWAGELRRLGQEGNYFFSLNRYVFVGLKPDA
ncbi:methyltransferase domain-containing protein [Oxalobacteraceae bacterium R-40]|uniref:Methyltransferase domain-containing protein n=1 Tax=Keguizhuia sedimenti TaxID=3064264 RepID=A0ABU1BRR2_9BURK|nr:methyltransferase domain-containing protein [Oxalobacteraceae bacterium R-40]